MSYQTLPDLASATGSFQGPSCSLPTGHRDLLLESIVSTSTHIEIFPESSSYLLMSELCLPSPTLLYQFLLFLLAVA